jgi:HemY protein
MRHILHALLLAVAVLVLAYAAAGLEGSLSLELGSYTLEAPASVALLLLLAGFAVLYVLLRLGGFLWRLPEWRARRRRERHRAAGDVAVTRALVALAAGDAAAARREAARARRLLGETAQTLLLAAEAGRLAGRQDETEAPLRLLAARPDAALLGLRGLLREAMARGEWREAAALARQAEAAHPGGAWLRAERAELAARAGHWAEALALTNAAGPRAALAVAAAAAEPDAGKALRLAEQAHKADPGLEPATLAYAARLRAAGRARRAEAVLREAWLRAPSQALADAYLEPITEPLARVQAARALVAGNPDHAESHFLLARVHLSAGLTGEARRQVEEAHKAGLDARRLWALLADIETLDRPDSPEGKAAAAAALRRAAGAAEDGGWHCASCGAAASAWAAVCGQCHSVGSLRRGAGGVPALS